MGVSPVVLRVDRGFEPEEKKYKVFATTTYVGESYTKNKVFTLCIDESWRETKRIRSPIFCKPRICINGVIYRFVFHRGLIAIAAFDVKTENSKLIALGNVSHEWHNELIELKGKLEVVVYEKWPHGHIHLQVLGQTQKKDEWESHTIHFPSTWKDIQPKVISPCTSGDGEIVFIANLKSGVLCLCYDVTRQSWRKLEIKGLPKKQCIKGICGYVDRLVM
ncbi:F-box protein At1g31080-like [Solanum verrucosum]|uniref:F-box protein At1g31080-like n=1 Tax=Solanum verrucosum TaxID=315347 RepID=UPI0020D1A9C2|nr:F-box protein At1g31080-like [Solanum verrucosum]